MLTWLDHLCRQTAKIVDERWHGGDPRRALAYHLAQEIMASQRVIPSENMNILAEAFYMMLAPFVAEFIPGGSP